MDDQETLARISDEWISFIMRGQTADETLAKLESLIEGGAQVVEVTFAAPFPDIRILPAGKMSLDLLVEYRSAGAFTVVVSVTKAMQLADAIQRRQFAEVTAATRQVRHSRQ